MHVLFAKREDHERCIVAVVRVTWKKRRNLASIRTVFTEEEVDVVVAVVICSLVLALAACNALQWRGLSLRCRINMA